DRNLLASPPRGDERDVTTVGGDGRAFRDPDAVRDDLDAGSRVVEVENPDLRTDGADRERQEVLLRPGRPVDALAGQAAPPGAVAVHHVQLRLAGNVRREGDLLPVGRPGRRALVRLRHVGGQVLQAAAVAVDDPDVVAAVTVRHEGKRLAVGRPGRQLVVHAFGALGRALQAAAGLRQVGHVDV